MTNSQEDDTTHLFNHPSDDESESNEINKGPIIIKATRSSLIGRIRTVDNVKHIEWSFIILSVISIGVGFGFTFYRMFTIPPDSDQYVFAILVMINLVFATFYMFHGVFQEQPFEILMYLFSTIILGALVTINFASGEPEKNKLRLTRFLVTMILSAPNFVIGCSLGWQYWTSGALIFKTVGADMKLQRMCRAYFFGLSLLVFDAQIGLSCVILILQNGISRMTNEEIVILVSGAMFTFIWLGVGYIGTRTENKKITWLFAVISIIQPLYVLYLFVQGMDFTKPYTLRIKCAFFAGIILLLAHFTLLSDVIIIASNYGKGLKSAIYGGDDDSIGSERSRSSGRSSIEEDEEPLIEAAGPSRLQGQNQNYDAITRLP